MFWKFLAVVTASAAVLLVLPGRAEADLFCEQPSCWLYLGSDPAPDFSWGGGRPLTMM